LGKKQWYPSIKNGDLNSTKETKFSYKVLVEIVPDPFIVGGKKHLEYLKFMKNLTINLLKSEQD